MTVLGTNNPVLLHKAQVIERCVARAREELALAGENFATDYTRQDAAILNLQRACEAALDMAQHVISRQGWGVAESARELFTLLQRKGTIDALLCQTLVRMVGFRNIAVHSYQDLDMAIVRAIISKDCADLLVFSQHIMQQFFRISDLKETPK